MKFPSKFRNRTIHKITVLLMKDPESLVELLKVSHILQSIPILRHFCLFTAFGVFMVYIFVMTFFIGCLVLDERRVTNRQVISCMAPKPDSWQPSKFSQKEIVPLFFDKILTPVMFKGPAKVRRSNRFT